MEKYRGGTALRAALSDVDAFVKQLEVAIKDEKEAQRMYDSMRHPIFLDRTDSVFKRMNMTIAGIRKDEGRHEHEFTEMLRETKDARKRIEIQIKRDEEEERKKSQVKEPNRRYGR